MNKLLSLIGAIAIMQFGTFSLGAQQNTESSSDYSRIDSYLTAGSKNGFSGAITVIKNGEIIINKSITFVDKMGK